jgi:hypothetical protein
MSRAIPAAFAADLLCAVSAAPAGAQTTQDDCATLADMHDRFVGTADTLLMDLVGRAMQRRGGGQDMMRTLGLGGVRDVGEAVRKGAVAAMPPTSQNAAMINLLRAQAASQRMQVEGCTPGAESASR